MIGQTISHYRITENLGEGGMGVVYKARDNRLGRTVAIKVITSQFDSVDSAKERLIREAQAAASLNHPNIATVYEMDEWEGKYFFAMEFVEGTTLREQVKARPLPLGQALSFIIQAVQGLDAAHGQGIVHRDVKSSNIMVNAQGQVKVMDFGLALLDERTRITGTGLAVGTPTYMAPEQIQGESPDHRADIWALGVVLYEMVSGKLPFAGDTLTAITHSILTSDFEPLTSLRSGLPIELDRVLAKALAKNPAERYQHLDDMLVDLRAVERQQNGGTEQDRTAVLPRPAGPGQIRRVLRPILALALLALVTFAAWFFLQREPRTEQVMRFISRLPEGQSFSGLTSQGSAITISRDGSEIVYVARGENQLQLWRRGIGDVDAEPIRGTEDGRAPFLSPDLAWIGFTTGKDVMRVSGRGGQAERIELRETLIATADIAFFGGSWAPDGDEIYIGECSRGLRRYSLDRNEKENVTDIESPEEFRQHQFPQVLPGGTHVLFTKWLEEGKADLAVTDVRSGEAKTLITSASHGRYVPTGHIVYGWEGNLYAVPFDVDLLEATGPRVLVVEGVLMHLGRGAVHFDVSDNGTLVYLPGGAIKAFTRLGWVDMSGKIETQDFIPGLLPGPIRIHPNGDRMLTHGPSNQAVSSIWLWDLERGTRMQLTNERQGNYWPVWSADGERVFFNGPTEGVQSYSLFSKPADSAAEQELLVPLGTGYQQACSASRDGSFLAYQEWDTDTETSDIWILPLKPRGPPYPFFNTDAAEVQPSFSPDGQWLAYATTESGRLQVMVRSFPEPGEVHQVSVDGGWEPLWSPDGDHLYFRAADGETIFVASFQSQPGGVRIGRPEIAATGRFRGGQAFGRAYDLSRDGQRFLVWLEPENPPAPNEYHVILNWSEELKELAPTED